MVLERPAQLPKKVLYFPEVLQRPAPEPAKKLLVPEVIEHPVLASPILMLLSVKPNAPPILRVVVKVSVPIPRLLVEGLNTRLVVVTPNPVVVPVPVT